MIFLVAYMAAPSVGKVRSYTILEENQLMLVYVRRRVRELPASRSCSG